MILVQERLAVDDVATTLGDARATLDAKASSAGKKLFVALALVVPGSVVLAAIAGGACFLPFVAGVIALAVYFSHRSKLNRAREKVAFAVELWSLLRDEVHARSLVVLDFDLRHYDESGKRTWEGKSSAGNPKSQYSDKWLRLRMTLADGTALEVVRVAGVKTKKGAVQKEKRRLLLRMRPSPRRYRSDQLAEGSPAAKALRDALKDSCREFHNSPEEFACRAASVDGALTIKVVQEDAPILAKEVLVLLGRALLFLNELRTPESR